MTVTKIEFRKSESRRVQKSFVAQVEITLSMLVTIPNLKECIHHLACESDGCREQFQILKCF